MSEGLLPPTPPHRFEVPAGSRGDRLSRVVSRNVEGLSVRTAKWLIDRGRVFVDDRRTARASLAVRGGARVEVYTDRIAGDRPLRREDILWEDGDLLLLEKPPGLAVHGTHGVGPGTLVPELQEILRREGRWQEGEELRLVHRLDRDTSGLLLVARDGAAARALEEQFRARRVEKRYRVLVRGRPRADRFRESTPVRPRKPLGVGRGRGPAGGRAAAMGRGADAAGVTEFRVIERFPRVSLLEATPRTGRTHQIRVQLERIGHPVLGDTLYGSQRCEGEFLRAVPRHMLHASFLGFEHPGSGAWMEFRSPLPEDMERVLRWLQGQAPPCGEGRGRPGPGRANE